jgi:ADP-heptose:LPS heptosyltransferase
MKLLVLRALGLGDLLTAVPALRGLRAAFPAARLQLACPGVLAPLALATGAVDEVVDVAPLGPLPAAVYGADLAVNLHGRGPQSTAVLAQTRPRLQLGWGLRGRQWRAAEHEVDRWCRLLQEEGIAADPTDLHLTPPPSRERGHVLVHPGAAKPSRRWPTGRWASVVRGLPGRVVVTAGPGEAALAAEVVRRAGTGEVRSPGLLELAALVGSARLVVAPDTGVAHLATAYRTPSVLLFGPTPPALWGPPPHVPAHVLWAGRAGDEAAAQADPGLLALTPAEVLRAAGVPA